MVLQLEPLAGGLVLHGERVPGQPLLPVEDLHHVVDRGRHEEGGQGAGRGCRVGGGRELLGGGSFQALKIKKIFRYF